LKKERDHSKRRKRAKRGKDSGETRSRLEDNLEGRKVKNRRVQLRRKKSKEAFHRTTPESIGRASSTKKRERGHSGKGEKGSDERSKINSR